jgi:hypothetical protein
MTFYSFFLGIDIHSIIENIFISVYYILLRLPLENDLIESTANTIKNIALTIKNNELLSVIISKPVIIEICQLITPASLFGLDRSL